MVRQAWLGRPVRAQPGRAGRLWPTVSFDPPCAGDRSCEKIECLNHRDTEAQRKGPFFSALSASVSLCLCGERFEPGLGIRNSPSAIRIHLFAVTCQL